MERKSRVGVATFVMRGKEYLVAIMAENGVLRAQTLRFPDEVRDARAVGLPASGKPSRRDVTAFERAIERLSKSDVAAGDLEDAYAESLRKLVARKRRKGQDVVEHQPAEEDDAQAPIDLLEVLKRSMRTGERLPARRAPAKRAAPASSRRKRAAAKPRATSARRKAPPRKTPTRKTA